MKRCKKCACLTHDHRELCFSCLWQYTLTRHNTSSSDNVGRDHPFQPGREVKIKPECMDKGDSSFAFIVQEDRGDRVLAAIHGTGMRFTPTCVILKSDIEQGD